MNRHSGIFLFLILIFSGCSTLSVKSDYNSDFDFFRLKTYAWLVTEETDSSKPGFGYPGLDEYIKQAINRKLLVSGYQELKSGKPDFLVGYHSAVEEKFDFQSACEYSGMRLHYWDYQARYRSCPVAARTYAKGTLVIDIIDPETDTIVWRGSAQSDIYQYGGRTEQQDRISRSIDKILQQFPPY